MKICEKMAFSISSVCGLWLLTVLQPDFFEICYKNVSCRDDLNARMDREMDRLHHEWYLYYKNVAM